jgi:hypothetical protein
MLFESIMNRFYIPSINRIFQMLAVIRTNFKVLIPSEATSLSRISKSAGFYPEPVESRPYHPSLLL